MSIAAIVLAAGASSRFGKPKQLLVFQGETLVGRAARTALEAGCSPVFVVTGAIDLDLGALEVQRVKNEQWREGIASSIRAGISAVDRADAVLLMTCDQPLVQAAALRELMEYGLTSGKAVIASAYANTVGIPAVFHRSVWSALLQLKGDEGAKRIILANRPRIAEFPLPEAALDIDSQNDFDRATEWRHSCRQ